MKVAVVVPARMASTRFPGKPLTHLLSLPMVEHVRRRAALAESATSVIVATCDREILELVEKEGGRAVMTADSHERCTERVAEAASATDFDAEIVVNLQGDEPLVRPEMIDAVVAPLLKDPSLPCANLMTKISDDEEWKSPDAVKVVVDRQMRALYFSRHPIPFNRSDDVPPRWKQTGIIAFRTEALQEFIRLEPTPLEIAESVDMMRPVEHGRPVTMVPWEGAVIGVDRPADVGRAEALLREDPLVDRYWKR